MDNIFLTNQELSEFTIISDSVCNSTLLNIVLTKVASLASYEDVQDYLMYLQDSLVPVGLLSYYL